MTSAIASRRGFTLVELLVVISVIALLIGILLPALAAARGAAEGAQSLSNVRGLAQANYNYAIDYGTFIGWSSGNDRKQRLYPYLQAGKNNADADHGQIWHCPSNKRLINDGTGETLEASYGFNTKLNHVPWERPLQPSKTVMLGDAGVNDDGSPNQATHLMSPGTKWSASLCQPNPRHNKGTTANIGWADGHADTQKLESPFYPSGPDVTLSSGTKHAWRPDATQTDPSQSGYLDDLWDLY